MNTYEQKYGNRAVKAILRVEAESGREARTKFQRMLDEQIQDGCLKSDVRLYGPAKKVS